MPSRPRPLALALLLLLQAQPHAQEGQAEKKQTPAVFCDVPRALAVVAQQVSDAKEMEDAAGRIAVMVRAADLLWPHEEKSARAVFADAFELASAHFRARGDETRNEKGRADSRMSGLSIQMPDQRFVVLRAVARRDPAWARELSERVAQETTREAEAGPRKPSAYEALRGGEKFLALAAELWEVDRAAAVQVFRLSFRHPASYSFQPVLYKIAGRDPALAASLYREALAAYADRTMEDLIYISAYPFGFFDIIGPATVSGPPSLPPDGFVPDPALQQLYVAALLRLGAKKLSAPPSPEPASAGHSERGQLYAALATLEPFVARTLPAFSERVAALKSRAATGLPEGELSYLTQLSRRQLVSDGRPEAQPPLNVEALLKQADRENDPDRRDQIILNGLLPRIADAPLESIVAAADKISDAQARRQFLDYAYLQHGRKAALGGALEEGARLADKIDALDDRALLLLLVAEEGLKLTDDRARAEQLLDAVTRAADRAPDTLARARALLGVAHLYARINYPRGVHLLGEAVKVVNKLQNPDLVSDRILRMVQGKSISFFTSYPVTGFNLENAFRELGRHDFDGALSAARGLDDRRLRGLASLAAAGRCLEQTPTKGRAAGQ
ncbi:MAG TPA: hypothetical protein VGX48_05835 [Pyrinomonadaceae bacterium]|jgi:hypothetical protein|nr:hypothetical protein [Pyrinomonadaceae bacterium]